MGAKYTTNATTGYNSSPPADDGSQVAANLVKWETHKTKLADPVKTLADDINADLVAAFDYSVRQITASDNTVASDHMRCVEIASTVTTAVTVSLGDAATMTNIYRVFIKNSSAINQTIGRVTSGDTIDGVAANLILLPGGSVTLQTNAAANGYLTVSAQSALDVGLCEFRMTLTTATPITTSDVTAATTVYVTPYKGNRISLYDGTSAWNIRASAEMSIAVPATTSTMYDLFCYDNSGTPTLESLAWTNDTTRATALVFQNGVYVKSGATTRRYLGSFRTTTVSGQTEDSIAKRYVWNYYNRARRPMLRQETTATWTYTNATLRQANNAAANQLDYVQGVSEDAIAAELLSLSNTDQAAGTIAFVPGIGVDSTSSDSSSLNSRNLNAGVTQTQTNRSVYRGFPGVGRHTLVWLESSTATGTTTWIGRTSGAQSGIAGELMG